MESNSLISTQPAHTANIFAKLKSIEIITKNDIHGFGRLEFYAVIVEHWDKCCPQVKRWLLSHDDRFIAESARAISEALA